jgi:tetratricopeptide (TPR) repeat protein
MTDQEKLRPQDQGLEELGFQTGNSQHGFWDEDDPPVQPKKRRGGFFEGAGSIAQEAEDQEAPPADEVPPAETRRRAEAPSKSGAVVPPVVQSDSQEPELEESVSRIQQKPQRVKVSGLKEALMKARGYYEEKNFQECIRILEDVLKVDPGNADAYSLLNEAQAKGEEDRQQREWLLKMQKTQREAREFLDQKNFEGALAKYNLLRLNDPKNKEFARLAAFCEEEIAKAGGSGLGIPSSSVLRSQETVRSGSPVQPLESNLPSAKRIFPPFDLQSPSAFSSPGFPFPGSPAAPTQPLPHSSKQVSAGGLFPTSPSGEHQGKAGSTEPPLKRPSIYLEYTSGPDWKKVIRISSLILLGLVILGGGAWWYFQPARQESSLTILSEPDDATLTIEGVMTAQTPLFLGTMKPGHYVVRLEKEGYQPLSQFLDVIPGQATQLTVRLQPLSALPESEVTPDNAQALFAQGKWVEAGRVVNALLEKNAAQPDALRIREEIRRRLSAQANKAMAASRWDEARNLWEKLLQVVPGDTEALGQLKEARTQLKKSRDSRKNSVGVSQAKIQAVRDQIYAALKSGNFLPPSSGNALEMIRQLESLSPGDPLAREGMDQIQRDLLSHAARKIQGKSFDEARSLLQQYQNNFPESAEFKSVQETLRFEENKLHEQKASSIQKAEAAFAAGHYVTPAIENACSLASRVLSSDPQNQRMIAIKRESLSKALAQARERVVRWKFDEANSIYSAFISLASAEPSLPFDLAQIKGEAEKVDFASFPVLHDHIIHGNCAGKLRVNGYVVSYVPEDNSRDGFLEKVTNIEQIESGDKLKIKFPNKLFKFEANGVESKEDNRQKIQQIYQALRRVAPNAH